MATPNPEAAATAPTQPRIIDENTDMTTLTDQEIMRLVEGMGQEDVTEKPLISAPVPLLVIREEYLSGSPTVVKKLDWLQAHGWDQVWRARGDGDCFYRSFTLAYLLRILHSPDPPLYANLAFESIQRVLPMMKQVNFDPDLYEEFLNPLLEMIQSFSPQNTYAEPITEYALIQALQDAERSNCIVVALRLITSAYIRTNSQAFEPFLLSPTTFLPLSADDFCRQEVEPCGKEADQVQITALSEALGVAVRIAYLDRSELVNEEGINWVVFGPNSVSITSTTSTTSASFAVEKVGGGGVQYEEGVGRGVQDEGVGRGIQDEGVRRGNRDEAGEGEGKGDERPLTLLYRPGHFDVVTKDVLPII
ncbi:ubiquitin thioesterase OTUB1 [Tremella mesenterica]|uniref:ubiquitinyl hydrolase 1 n=1 Tax=Tremella mesenterica TaxID=5217 RepID=A0A4Q1BHC8_TREME|nr:ubiquitin thioesterase OTUB1 [Tremella mesenterica]